MNINQYLETTYLKTPGQSNLSKEETQVKVIQLIDEAIHYNFKLVMIRANYISQAKRMISEAKSTVLIGTVIGFHKGTIIIEEKLSEAEKAIHLGVDELDFVVNYQAFKKGDIKLVKEEILKGTSLCLENNKVVKWIVETAALTNQEIIVISRLIKNIVIDHFGIENTKKVFVKSSTGFYKTAGNKPNGATLETMKIMIENAKPLQIKAAGGVRDFVMAAKMIALGVHRVGTSSAKKIVENN